MGKTFSAARLTGRGRLKGGPRPGWRGRANGIVVVVVPLPLLPHDRLMKGEPTPTPAVPFWAGVLAVLAFAVALRYPVADMPLERG